MKKAPFFALLLLLLDVGATAQSKEILAAADSYPPFVDPNDSAGGLSMAIVREAYATQGYEVRLIYVSWARAIAGTEAGEIDIVPDAWMTEERKKTFAYGEPYLSNEIVFIKRKGDTFEYTGMPSLKGKKIGVVNGYAYGDDFLNSPDFTREKTVDFLTSLKMLVYGRIDLTLEDRIVAAALIGKADSGLLEKIEFTEGYLSKNLLYVAVGLDNPRHNELIAAFNAGLATIEENGTMKKILASYGID